MGSGVHTRDQSQEPRARTPTLPIETIQAVFGFLSFAEEIA